MEGRVSDAYGFGTTFAVNGSSSETLYITAAEDQVDAGGVELEAGVHDSLSLLDLGAQADGAAA